ncbi:MAG: ABC transporter ATP-binding protein [Candidatus Omnitrophica bacterium]|nr:ABC transporter ATP-binding protein [Candidatus Omnitrophota bacterium]
MSDLLEAAGLRKSYHQGAQALEVLKGVGLVLQAGEVAAIVGPSGAGKSTLLHLLGGLDRPTDGAVRFEGRDLYGLPDRARAQIRSRAFGFVFQFYHLVPELTVLENVSLPAWMANGAGGARAGRERAAELLEEVGLSHRLTHRSAELSGGEQQRVAIARALMNRPRLVFCDEPTGNLDSETGKSVLKLLLRINQEEKTAFLIATHEPAITQVAGRVLHLKDGRLWDSKST